MKEKYTIILFKNKVRYKIIKSYKTLENAESFFKKKVKESNDVIFDIKTEKGEEVKYEIALIEKTHIGRKPIYVTDELGRNIPIISNDPEFSILKIQPFKISEKIYHVDKKTKIEVSYLISTFLRGDTLKLISKLNNKIVIQNDNIFNLFSLKTEEDAERFLDNIEIYLVNNNKKNCLLAKDSDIAQKKYLYDILSNLGYDKKMLYRKTTTHPISK